MNAPAKIDIDASHQTRLGCSKIAQALGLSRWGSAYQLWEQYTNRAPWPNISNDLRVALGEPMEAVLKPHVELRLGRNLRRDRKEYLHPDLPLIGHIDYRASSLNGEPRPVVDMKTSLGFGAKTRFGDDGTDEVDDDVLIQMQGYLLLTGAQTAYVAALVPGPELKIYTIAADTGLQGLICNGIEEFWWHVQNDAPPAVATDEDAVRRWPQHQDGIAVTADSVALSTWRELRELNSRIKELEVARDVCELALKVAIGDAEVLLDANGKPLCTWKTQTSRRVDPAALKAAGLYESYTKQSTSRVFRLQGEK